MSVPKTTESEFTIVTLPRRSLRNIPHRHVHRITHSSSSTKNLTCLTCILCNKTLDISNSDHTCEVRPCVDEFSIKFN